MTTAALLVLAVLAVVAVAAIVKGLHLGARSFTRDRQDLRWADQFKRDVDAVTADPTLRLTHPDTEVTS